MHSLLGYSWAEIASILAAASVFFSGVYWLVKHGAKVVNNAIIVGTFPLQQQFKELNNTIKQLNSNFKEQHKNLEKLRVEVSRHHDELIEHETRIGNLEGDKK